MDPNFYKAKKCMAAINYHTIDKHGKHPISIWRKRKEINMGREEGRERKEEKISRKEGSLLNPDILPF